MFLALIQSTVYKNFGKLDVIRTEQQSDVCFAKDSEIDEGENKQLRGWEKLFVSHYLTNTVTRMDKELSTVKCKQSN